MKTRSEVMVLLAELNSLKWFGSVGLPLAIEMPRWLITSRAESWSEAGRVIRSNRTEEFLIETQNELYVERSEALKGIQSGGNRVLEFNAWITEVKASIRAVAGAACCSSGIPRGIGADYEKVLFWMVQKACVIRQFDEHIKYNRLVLQPY